MAWHGVISMAAAAAISAAMASNQRNGGSVIMAAWHHGSHGMAWQRSGGNRMKSEQARGGRAGIREGAGGITRCMA